MKASSEDRELIDMATAVEMLQTTRPTFYRWLRAGKVKGHKVGRQWRFYRDDIERFLKGQAPRIELPVSPASLLSALAVKLKDLGESVGEPGDEPVTEIVNRMIRLGWRLRASDVHVGPLITEAGGEMTGMLRYRIDGVMAQATRFDRRLLPAIVERWKTLSAADPREHLQPQDGQIRIDLEPIGESRRLDIRVSFVCSPHGESLTARILDPAAVAVDLDRLGYAAADRQRLDEALSERCGLIFCTGPTGSGKTTAMYACVNEVTGPGLKVMSVEDPVEYLLPWVTQLPVRTEQDVTFARLVRATLRSDPDVIMVGEIRDRETVELCLQAALTGHLVFSQLHAGSAAGALVRLVEMGCAPFVVAEATRLVMSQRLVRRLCAKCARPYDESDERLDRVRQRAESDGLDWNGLQPRFLQPVGCLACARTGYRGRLAICETLPVKRSIGRALRDGAGVEDLQRLAVKEGMTTVAADGIRRAAAGETSLDEVFRVVAAG